MVGTSTMAAAERCGMDACRSRVTLKTVWPEVGKKEGEPAD